jgi:hypothetical protein
MLLWLIVPVAKQPVFNDPGKCDILRYHRQARESERSFGKIIA